VPNEHIPDVIRNSHRYLFRADLLSRSNRVVDYSTGDERHSVSAVFGSREHFLILCNQVSYYLTLSRHFVPGFALTDQESAEADADMKGAKQKIDVRSTLGSGKLEDRAMSTSDEVQKRNAFAACAAFRIEGLEASLDHAREIAVREELGAVGHYIEKAQGHLAQIRVLHQEALDEFSRAQGE